MNKRSISPDAPVTYSYGSTFPDTLHVPSMPPARRPTRLSRRGLALVTVTGAAAVTAALTVLVPPPTASEAAAAAVSMAATPASHTCTLHADLYEDGSWGYAGGVVYDGVTVSDAWIVDDYRIAGTVTTDAAGLRTAHVAWSPGWGDAACTVVVGDNGDPS